MKYAIVTGGTKGIGKAYVLELLSKGYFVIINYNQDRESALELDKQLDIEHAGKYVLMPHDLSDVERTMEFCNKITNITSCIDLFVFNVGFTDRTSFPNIKIENWQKALDTNLTIPLLILQNIVHLMVKGGNVVFTSSLMGIYPHSLSLSYGVTKASINAFVKNMVKFLAPFSIRINSIVPGFIETEWQKNKPVEIRKSIESKIACNTFGRPQDVAKALVFIIDNNYVNGQEIVVDGGYCYR